MLLPGLDHLPATDHHQDGEKAVEQDEQHRQTVHTEVVVDVVLRHPGGELDELHGAGAGIEAEIQRDGHQEAGDGRHQTDHLGQAGIALGAGKQDQDGSDDGNPDGKAK